MRLTQEVSQWGKSFFVAELRVNENDEEKNASRSFIYVSFFLFMFNYLNIIFLCLRSSSAIHIRPPSAVHNLPDFRPSRITFSTLSLCLAQRISYPPICFYMPNRGIKFKLTHRVSCLVLMVLCPIQRIENVPSHALELFSTSISQIARK